MTGTRAVTDVVGSTVASVAQVCAREVLKRCAQVRQSRTIGEFVFNSGIAELRRRFTPPHRSAAPEATVPATVASASPREPTTSPAESAPIADYELLTSAQVVELLETFGKETVRTVLEYELTHRRRRLVVEAAQRVLDS